MPLSARAARFFQSPLALTCPEPRGSLEGCGRRLFYSNLGLPQGSTNGASFRVVARLVSRHARFMGRTQKTKFAIFANVAWTGGKLSCSNIASHFLDRAAHLLKLFLVACSGNTLIVLQIVIDQSHRR